jgi:DNA-binding transcriptional MerR regulator
MELLTTKRVAALLGITPDAVRYHEREGHLLAVKVERGPNEFQRLFLREDVDRFLRQRAARRELVAATKERPDTPGGLVQEVID